MKEQLKNRLLTKYPEWHQKPLRLSIKEIEDPYKVLTEFFEIYSLPDIRACLKEWLTDAIMAPEAEPPDHITTCDHIEKLVEAVSLIHNKKIKKRKG